MAESFSLHSTSIDQPIGQLWAKDSGAYRRGNSAGTIGIARRLDPRKQHVIGNVTRPGADFTPGGIAPLANRPITVSARVDDDGFSIAE